MFDHDHFCLAVIEHVLEIRRYKAKIDGHQRRANSCRTEKRLEHPMTVLRQNANAVARSDPKRTHHLRPSVYAVSELAIGKAMIAANDGFFVGINGQGSF